jgi:single-stranded-DNA-specific exonuclease
MPKTWIDPEPVATPADLQTLIGGHPLVAQTLARRGIADPGAARAFLDPAHYSPAPASDLPDMMKAAERIEQAIRRGERILVWGDFDVDGQTATTLLVEALRNCGAQVGYHIPVRASEGHGIQLEKLQDQLLPAAHHPPPTVLLTCDTGISAHEAVAFAQGRGVDVIISDHHEPGETLPEAYAVVNPHRLEQQPLSPGQQSARHPLSTLPGVGVAFKLVEALSSLLPHSPAPESYLDLVALGIVADVAEQTGDTRYLLQRGLPALRNTPRLGLRALYEMAKLVPAQIDEGHIGFTIGPRLNALGRLSDANASVEFLTSDDAGRARLLAARLEALNERRKLLTGQITQAALALIERERALLNDYAALVLAQPGWHTGVVGIVASRLVEQFGKPTILLSIGEDGLARGSARSLEGLHITEAIGAQKALLTGFGGHAGAAGLALPAENIPAFRRGFSRAIEAQWGGRPPEPALPIDAWLALGDLSLELVDEISRLGPFGAGNPPLTLATGRLWLVSATVIGQGREHLRLVVSDADDRQQELLWWGGAGSELPEAGVPFDLAYRARASSYQGTRQLQLEWLDFRVSAAPRAVEVETRPIEWVDLRGQPHPRARLQSLQTEEVIQVYAEGEAQARVGGLRRDELSAGLPLAIWTPPPGPRQWSAVLERAAPPKVYLLAVESNLDVPEHFLKRLAGLVKFALRTKGGQTTLAALAAATAQRGETVRMGLLWLEAKGYISGDWRAGSEEWTSSEVYFSAGSGEESADLAEITAELGAMLAETAAYRRYFQTMQLSQG